MTTIDATVSDALKKAYNLGQRYWQQADNRRSTQERPSMTTIDATVAQLMVRVNALVNAESHLASGPLIWGKVYDEKKVPIFKMHADLEAALRAALTEAQPVQPSQALEFFRAGCKQCDRQKQADADNKEWQEGVKRGNEIVSAMAHAAINAKGTK